MSNELTTSQQALVPEYMRGEKTGTEGLHEFFVPPTLKVVQALSADSLKERFNEGDVIMLPSQLIVAPVNVNAQHKPMDTGQPFFFVPVLFFPEWVLWSPIALRGSEPAVLGRTFDREHEIAVFARDEEKRRQPHPDVEGEYVNYVEHLNFLIVLVNHELQMTPMTMSFARAEHFRGKTFCSLIKMSHAPIFGRVYRGQAGKRENAKGRWYGIDVTNPDAAAGEPGPWVDQDTYNALGEVHAELSEMLTARRLRPDYSPDEEESAGDSKASF